MHHGVAGVVFKVHVGPRARCFRERPQADSLLYPGVPTEPRPPIRWGDFSILTSVNKGSWRVTERGVRVDKPFSWRNEPEQRWQDVVRYVTAGAKRRKTAQAAEDVD